MRSLLDSIFRRLGRRACGHPRSPLLAAVPLLVEAVATLVVGFAAGIGWASVALVACLLAALGVVRSVRAVFDRERQRRLADDWLLWGAAARPSAALLSWRAAELCSPWLRSSLARSLQRIEREVRGASRPGSVPLNDGGLRQQLNLVQALAERLQDRSRPVTVQGMLLADRLLTEPWSPLYSAVSGEELAGQLRVVLEAIDTEISHPLPFPPFPAPTEIRIEHRAHRRSGLR
jgi:hypothetical protein